MSYIDYTPLRLGILAYKKYHGTYVELAQATDNQVSNSTVARIAKGAIAAPSLDLWLALHQAAPQYIPLPELAPIKGRKSAAVWASGILPRLARLNLNAQTQVEKLLDKLSPATPVPAGKATKVGRPPKTKEVKAKVGRPPKTKEVKTKVGRPPKTKAAEGKTGRAGKTKAVEGKTGRAAKTKVVEGKTGRAAKTKAVEGKTNRAGKTKTPAGAKTGKKRG